MLKREDFFEMSQPRHFLVVSVSLSFALLLVGCAATGGVKQESARVVHTGDTADVDYLCRLRNREIAAATGNVAQDQPKSGLYVMRTEKGPLSVVAARPDGQQSGPKYAVPEEEITYRISFNIVGMKEGESKQIELTSTDIPLSSEKSHVSRLARVRTRPKEMTMSVEEYRKQTGKSPEPGQEFTIDPSFPGRVETVTDKDVVIRFARPGDVIETPFGPGVVGEEANDYKIRIDARKGALIRVDTLVGRVTDVSDKVITIDFRNPFGGETLVCDVTVGKITAAKPTEETEEESGHN